MSQNHITHELDQFLRRDYSSFHYTKNKSDLFQFLKLLQENVKSYTQEEMGQALTQLKVVFQKLKQTQDHIHADKLGGRKVSFLHSLLLQLNAIMHLFQKIVYGMHRLDDLAQLARTIEETQAMKAKPKNQSAARKKFRDLVKKLHPITIGTSVKDTVSLNQDYWLEAMGMRIVIDDKICNGHLYTGYMISQDKCLDTWKSSRDEQGVLYCEKLSFEDYMNTIFIPHLSDKEKEILKAKLSVVEYFTPAELADFETHFDEAGRIYTANSCLNQWVEFKQKNPDSTFSYQEFRREFRQSILEASKERDPIQMDSILKDQTYLYILDHQGRLFLQMKNRGRINHTSLSNGHAVLAAGSLKVEKGCITEIDTFSGHYKPTVVQLKNFLRFLKQSHVNLDQIKVTYVAEYSVQPWVIREIKPGQLLKWLDEDR